MAMHPDLDARLKRWKEATVALRVAEAEFRKADVLRKAVFAQMVTNEKATTKSIAECEYKVQATEEWKNLMLALADAETEYNFRRADYELKQNAFYGMLASVKRESEHIDKRGA